MSFLANTWNTAKLLLCFVYVNLGSGAIYGAKYIADIEFVL
jgi:hypothetical protein